MITFLDGPAKGKSLTLGRTPMFLRVVNDGEKWDALDQLEDTPEPQEKIHVYKVDSTIGYAHIDGRDKKTGKRFGKTIAIAEYRLFTEQPPDDVPRDNEKWGEWATLTGTRLLKEKAGG